MLDSFLCDQFLYSRNKTNFVFDTHVHKLAGAERVKEWLVHSICGQLQCKLAALNFLLETSSIILYRIVLCCIVLEPDCSIATLYVDFL